MARLTYPQKITSGELRETDVSDVLVSCRAYRCSHIVTLNADRWPDGRMSDVEPRFICTVCGQRGGDLWIASLAMTTMRWTHSRSSVEI